MQAAINSTGFSKPRRVRWGWRLLFLLLSGVTLVFFSHLALGTAAAREDGFTLGASTFLFEFEADSSQEEFFTQAHDRADPSSGNFDSRHDFTVRLGSGVMHLRVERDPVAAIRKRLPENPADLARLIESRNQAEVFCAAEVLAQKDEGDISLLPKLIDAAERNGVVYRAIDQIALAAPKLAVPSLITGLSSTNLELRGTCAALLGRAETNGTAAVPALLAAFKTSRLLQPTIAQALFNITGDCSATLPALQTLVASSAADYYLKFSALNCLQLFGPKAEPAVADILQLATTSRDSNAAAPRNPDLQAAAIRVLSHVSTNPAIVLPPILAALTEDPVRYANLRASAIGALGRVGPAGLPQLIDLYSSTNQSETLKAARALAEIGPPAADFLEVFERDLISTKPDRVTLACEVIAHLRERAAPAIPTLFKLLHVPNRRIRIHAAATLTRLGQYNDTMVKVLVDALAEMSAKSHLYFSEQVRALQTLTQIIQTNSAARTVVDERRTSNPQVVRFLPSRQLVERYGLQASTGRSDCGQ